MKYYLIVGEASGDLHASHLMQALKEVDSEAQFRFFGGDLMAAVGGQRVRHYRELAYMGIVAVAMHLPTILRNLRFCKRDIVAWQPDVVILVDYPGFNLKIARFLRSQKLKAFYYISPKIWAWKEHRIKNIRRDVDELFSILPFEVPFFEQKHHYPIHYVGNPTADEVRLFQQDYHETFQQFAHRNKLSSQPIIALLAGSRQQEIKSNLPQMIAAAQQFPDYQMVLAAAPGIDDDFYTPYIKNTRVRVVRDQTYPLLSHAHAALVTSGTATLETALFRVPQVVCYAMHIPHIVSFFRPFVLKVKYVSLVNLIADREVVPELVAADFTPENLLKQLAAIVDGPARQQMLDGYADVWQRLGNEQAPRNAARLMVQLLTASRQSDNK